MSQYADYVQCSHERQYNIYQCLASVFVRNFEQTQHYLVIMVNFGQTYGYW